ncbi:WbqC family protein [Phaeocystidibacter luteus]|uniref:WbqC family protein n=1 Tax=Phaeocystidibacter luteus TaxID=911197 RepID=A0A6N6RLZ6_9FLAO|nr:WbqC family protein [Phaeocystidibacter luteus]KAB2814611.1 WbqC family protein [Phaeocystidibacter luteus]
MKPAVFYPALFPPTSYMAWLISEKASWNTAAAFQKGSWRNRYRIYGPNGTMDLSAPIDHSSDKSSLSNIKLERRNNWTEKEWRALQTAYRNASFFEAIEDELSRIILKEHDFLLDRIEEAMNWMCGQLRCDAPADSSEQPLELMSIKPSKAVDGVEYRQVFSHKHGFQSNLSTLDLLMNEGPLAYDILQRQAKLFPFSQE